MHTGRLSRVACAPPAMLAESSTPVPIFLRATDTPQLECLQGPSDVNFRPSDGISPTMVRLFNVYYPLRSLVLLCGEAFVICSSFLLSSRIEFGADSYLVLNLEYYYSNVIAATG